MEILMNSVTPRSFYLDWFIQELSSDYIEVYQVTTLALGVEIFNEYVNSS